MPITQSWFDNSGLFQVYGVDQATTENGGEYKTFGELREIEISLTLNATNFAFGATNYIPFDNIFVPAGVRIQEVETFVETAGAGATATLDVGLMRTDRSTVTSATGLVAGKTVASMTAGEKVVLTVGSTFAGALIGTTTANVNYITVRVNTANFTAGVIKVRVRYYRP
jgi:hypothetical protein